MHATKVSSLTIYPVKPMRGINLRSAVLDDMGIRWDRRWMVVDENFCFIIGRQQPLYSGPRKQDSHS